MALYGCSFHFFLGASNASCLLWHIWKTTLLFVLKLATDWFDNLTKFFLLLSVFSPNNSTHLSMAVEEWNASCCAVLAEVQVKELYQFTCPESAMKHSAWFLYVVFLNSRNCNYSILPAFLTFTVFSEQSLTQMHSACWGHNALISTLKSRSPETERLASILWQL